MRLSMPALTDNWTHGAPCIHIQLSQSVALGLHTAGQTIATTHFQSRWRQEAELNEAINQSQLVNARYASRPVWQQKANKIRRQITKELELKHV